MFHISQKALFNCLAKSAELNSGDWIAFCLRFLLISISNWGFDENLIKRIAETRDGIEGLDSQLKELTKTEATKHQEAQNKLSEEIDKEKLAREVKLNWIEIIFKSF